MQSEEPIILSDIKKKYGIIRRKQALDGVSLSVKRGEVVCLVGPNGAGKSTLLKIAGKIIGKYNGSIVCSSKISYVPENSVYFPNMTGFENLHYYGKILGKSGEEILGIMKQLDLSNSKILASNFSKGMKRKLDIARAILADSAVVLMDEPFDGLEPKICDELISYINDLKHRGKTFIISSHELSRVQSIADRVFFMDQGRIRTEYSSLSTSCFYIELAEGFENIERINSRNIEVLEIGKENNSAIIKISDDISQWDAIRYLIDKGLKIVMFTIEPLESKYRRTYGK